MKKLLLTGTHLFTLIAGFALGVYTLPILIAPAAPLRSEIADSAKTALYSGSFRRELKDSDALHWGEGVVSVGVSSISLLGELAPGPDYKLYLSKDFVETEADFKRLKPGMVRVADVKTFRNFVVPVSPGINVSEYTTIVIWCETFNEFITSARYR